MLEKIQSKLSVPKNQYNSFGKYSYRSCEDIMEALKPVLAEHKCYVIISDTIQLVADRIYVCAYVKLFNEKRELIAENSAFAREAESKKGMDASQLTGATSSYARKYALAGMFLLDDNKDADTMPPPKAEPKSEAKIPAKKNTKKDILKKILSIDSFEKLKKAKEWILTTDFHRDNDILAALDAKEEDFKQGEN